MSEVMGEWSRHHRAEQIVFTLAVHNLSSAQSSLCARHVNTALSLKKMTEVKVDALKRGSDDRCRLMG